MIACGDIDSRKTSVLNAGQKRSSPYGFALYFRHASQMRKGDCMKQLLVLSTIAMLLATVAPPLSARAKYHSVKSNTGKYVISYSEIVTLAQAAAILTDLDRGGEDVDEPTVREILRKQGVQNDRIKKVIIEARGGGGDNILLLENAGDEAAARSAAALDGTSGSQTATRERDWR
jgi:hypothetical protein